MAGYSPNRSNQRQKVSLSRISIRVWRLWLGASLIFAATIVDRICCGWDAIRGRRSTRSIRRGRRRRRKARGLSSSSVSMEQQLVVLYRNCPVRRFSGFPGFLSFLSIDPFCGSLPLAAASGGCHISPAVLPEHQAQCPQTTNP